jgi:hypothetical protein
MKQRQFSKLTPKQLGIRANALNRQGSYWLTRSHEQNIAADYILARAYRRISAGFYEAAAILTKTAAQARQRKTQDDQRC